MVHVRSSDKSLESVREVDLNGFSVSDSDMGPAKDNLPIIIKIP